MEKGENMHNTLSTFKISFKTSRVIIIKIQKLIEYIFTFYLSLQILNNAAIFFTSPLKIEPFFNIVCS